jgi:hypothetical protein
LISDKKGWNKFRVVDNFEEQVMKDFFEWLRFAEYDGDMSYLYLFKNEAVIAA